MSIDQEKRLMSILGYLATDILQIPLDVTSKNIVGKTAKIVNFGPFSMSFPVQAKSEVYDSNKVGLLAQLRGHLWCYVYISAQPEVTALIFFKSEKGFGEIMTGDPVATLKKLGKSVSEAFALRDDKWVPMDTSEVIK